MKPWIPLAKAFVVTFVILGALSFSALADVVVLQPVKDNTLYEEIDGKLSNGAGQHFFAGNTDELVIRRGLLAFEIAGNIPAGATINSVTLTLYCSKRAPGSGTQTVSLHLLTSDWGEGTSDAVDEEGKGANATPGDATWLHTFYPGQFWTAPGGDYSVTASGSTPVGNTGYYTWTSAGMVADVQAWLDMPSTNFGWAVVGNESESKTVRRFDTRENPNVGRRPDLVIDFTPLEVTGACCLGDTCDILTAADCATLSGVYQGDGTTCSPNPCVIPTGACCFNDATCDTLSEADCLLLSGNYQGDGSACIPDLCELVLEPFVDSLPIPVVATPTLGTAGGVATYDMVITEFQQKLHRDLPPTTVWGYGGSYPAPTILASPDNLVTVNWINDLRDSNGVLRTTHYLPVDLCMHGPDSLGPTPRTVTHLHGAHVGQESDGYPEDTVLPGQQQTYFYPNHQRPATLWFHDHALGITRLNVMMGLAGFYLMTDAFEQSLGLPSGEFDIGLAIADRTFNADGTFQYPAQWQDNFFGDKILVNGKVWPYLNVKQGKYRFRMLAGANSRSFTLSLSTGDPFWAIGSEGGLFTTPVMVDSVTITPGERIEVIMDFSIYSPGTEIILRNSAPAPFPGSPGVGVVPDVMKFIVQGVPGHIAAVPDTLRPVIAIPESLAVATRDFVLDKQADPCAGTIWTINGLHWDDITERPILDTTEIWRFINRSGMIHPMHMHLVMFQVLDRTPFTVVADSIIEGTPVPPDPVESGWKDTVPVYPNEIVRVIATFEDYLGKFAYHCHILEHEDHEMMRQFEVIADTTATAVGDEPPSAARLKLGQAYPNPFNPTTRIDFEIPVASHVRLDVYDVAGRHVTTLIDETLSAGGKTAVWDGHDNYGQLVASGVYFYRLSVAGQGSLTKKMVLLK